MLEAILKQRDDSAWVLLEERSLIDEKGALQSKDATYVLTPADVTPWLHRLSMVVLALAALCSLPDRYTSGVAALMLEQQKGEGFGHPMPILESTYWVVESLKALDRLASMPETARWVLECENESRGLSASLSSKNYFHRKPLLRAENPASARLNAKARQQPREVHLQPTEREQRLPPSTHARRVKLRVHVLRYTVAKAPKPPLAPAAIKRL